MTQWFRNITTPFKQPYGQYRIITHLNIDGFAYALSMDGQTYPLNRMWKEVYGESITYLKELILLEEKNWKKLFIENNNSINKFRNMNNKKS